MSALCFAFLANIEISTNNTFISDSNNWISSTFVTSYMGMNNLSIDFLFDFRLFLFHLLFTFSNLALWHNFLFNFWNNLRHNFTEFFMNWFINTLLWNFCFFFNWWFWNFLGNFNLFHNSWFFFFLHRFIFNNNLLSMIIKVFIALLDFNSDLAETRLEEGFHIDIIEEADHIVITVFVCKCVFGWQFLENWFDEGLKVAVSDDVLGVHHVDLVSVHYLEEHKTLLKNDYIKAGE